MNRIFVKMKTASLLLLVAGGLCSALFSSCANSGTKTGGLSPSNPAYYNPDSREFESRWPFGPAGYR
jgi:hypothetical protein